MYFLGGGGGGMFHRVHVEVLNFNGFKLYI